MRIAITMKDGRKLEKYIEHAVGSVDRPLPDKDLELKVAGLADAILPAEKIRRVIDLCWGMENSADAAALARAATA